MILSFFMDHFWQYNYFPLHEPFYHGAAWPNVAVIPLAGLLLAIYHFTVTRPLHKDLKEAHAKHDAHLRKIIEALDPEATSESQLDVIADRLDENTPSGIGVILKKLDAK